MKKRSRSRLGVITIISSIIIVLSTVITIINSICSLNKPIKIIANILSNPYVSGLICSIGLVFMVFYVQICMSKRRIKNDFRCNEIMEGLFEGIDKLERIIKNRKTGETDKEFITNNKGQLYVIKLILTYNNNSILIDSINMCFFLNLNFELLGIINHIKNRIPTVENEKKVSAYLDSTINDNVDFSENEAKEFLLHLKFLAGYWKSLLDYMDYDNSYNLALLDYYKKIFPIESSSIQDISIRMRMIKMTFGKEIKKALKEKKKSKE